jgi:hypothetical protein
MKAGDKKSEVLRRSQKAAIPSHESTRRDEFRQVNDRNGNGKSKIIASKGDETWPIFSGYDIDERPAETFN